MSLDRMVYWLLIPRFFKFNPIFTFLPKTAISAIDTQHFTELNVDMDEVKKMFRTIVNGQSAIKQELLSEIKKVDNKVDKLETKVDVGFKKVIKRLDIIGKTVAFIEDDTPTVEDFEKLEKRVSKLEERHLKN
jgi:hypothetical protein